MREDDDGSLKEDDHGNLREDDNGVVVIVTSFGSKSLEFIFYKITIGICRSLKCRGILAKKSGLKASA